MKIPTFFKSQKFFSLASSILNSAIALVTFALLAKSLSKADFGAWATFLAVYGFFGMSLNGLIRTPVIRMAANKSDYTYEEVLASAWDILIKSSLSLGIIVGAVYLLAGLITDDEAYIQSSYWFLLLIIADIPGLIAGWNSNAQMKFERILVIRLVSASTFLLGVLYVYLTNSNLQYVYWFYLLSSAIVGTMVLIQKWSGFQNYLHSKKTYRKEIIGFGKFSMGTTISSSLLASSDIFIIRFFLGDVAVALYEVPKRIKGLYDIPLRSILQLSYPYLSKKVGETSKESFRTEFSRLAGFTMLLLFPVALLIFIYADFLVVFLADESYIEAGDILRVFAIFLMISPLDRFSGLVLDVINRPNVNFTKVLVILGVNILGNIVAIKLGYGLVGVAAVTFFAAVAGITYGFYKHRKEIPFRPVLLFLEGIKQTKILIKGILKG